MSSKQSAHTSITDSIAITHKKIQTNIAAFRRVSTHSISEGYFESGFVSSPRHAEAEASAHNIKELLLPCFGGVGTIAAIEDLNIIVRFEFELIRKWADNTPGEQILNEITDILRIGMGVIAFKLQTTSNETLGTKMAELWINFNSNTINTIQASLLPLKFHSKLLANSGGQPWDLRGMTMASYTEYVIMPNKFRIERN